MTLFFFTSLFFFLISFLLSLSVAPLSFPPSLQKAQMINVTVPLQHSHKASKIPCPVLGFTSVLWSVKIVSYSRWSSDKNILYLTFIVKTRWTSQGFEAKHFCTVCRNFKKKKRHLVRCVQSGHNSVWAADQHLASALLEFLRVCGLGVLNVLTDDCPQFQTPDTPLTISICKTCSGSRRTSTKATSTLRNFVRRLFESISVLFFLSSVLTSYLQANLV